MKGFLFITVLTAFCSFAHSQNLQQAEKKLTQELHNVNQQLNDSRTQTFSARQDLILELKTAEKEYESTRIKSLAQQDELERLLMDIGELEADIKRYEQDLKDIQTATTQSRREIETLIPRQSLSLYSPFLEKYDQTSEAISTKASFPTIISELMLTLINDGFTLKLSSCEGINGSSIKDQGKLISLGHNTHYLILGNQGGLAINTPDHDLPSIKFIPGTAENLASLESQSETTLGFDFTAGMAFEKTAAKKTFWQHLKAGGVIIYPLLFLGFLCLCTGLYKSLQLYTVRSRYDDKVNHLISLINAGDREGAKAYVSGLKDPIRSLLNEALTHHEQTRENLEELLNENILAQLPKLDRFLPILSVTAGAAPLLGLLGTVMGIIKTFEMISIYGTGDANRMAGGISEALITTEAGLLVAIPALLWYSILNRRLKAIVGNLEKAMLSFINAISVKDAKDDVRQGNS